MMLRREVLARVVLTAVQPGTNIADHVENEVAKAKLPVLNTAASPGGISGNELHRHCRQLPGLAGHQVPNFLARSEALGGLPETTKLAS